MLLVLFVWDRRAEPINKIKYMPFITFIGCAIFAFGGLWASNTWEFSYIIIPAVAGIGYVNYKLIRICTLCGKVHPPNLMLTPTKFCSECGNKFT